MDFSFYQALECPREEVVFTADYPRRDKTPDIQFSFLTRSESIVDLGRDIENRSEHGLIHKDREVPTGFVCNSRYCEF